MHTASRSLAGLAACLALTVAAACLAPAVAAPKAKAEAAPAVNYSKAFRKEAVKVQKLVTDQKWDEVLAALPALQALPELTDDDRRAILSWQAAAYQSKEDWPNLAVAYAAAAESGLVEPAKLPDYYRTIAAIYSSRLKDNAKALVYFRKSVETTAEPSEDDLHLLLQLTRQQKDCPALIEWTGKASAIMTRRGGAPREAWLQSLDSCFIDLGDKARRLANLEELTRRFPKRDYYTRIMTLYGQGSNDDRTVMINMYRLAMKDVGLATVGEYLGYSDVAMSLGSPGESARALEKGMADAVVPKAGSNTQFLTDARNAVASDRKTLPVEEKAAVKAAKGEVDVKVGLGFYSLGDNQRALDNIQRGLAKGGVKRLDDANMLLGIVLTELGRRDEAQAAFTAAAKAAGAGSWMERVANLWLAYAARPAPVAAAPAPTPPPATPPGG